MWTMTHHRMMTLTSRASRMRAAGAFMALFPPRIDPCEAPAGLAAAAARRTKIP